MCPDAAPVLPLGSFSPTTPRDRSLTLECPQLALTAGSKAQSGPVQPAGFPYVQGPSSRALTAQRRPRAGAQ